MQKPRELWEFTKRKIGLLVSHLDDDLANALFDRDASLDYDLIVFYENPPATDIVCNFAVMNIAEAYDYDGIVIATELRMAAKLSKMPGPRRRIFFDRMMSWGGPVSFEEARDVYGDDRLIKVCKNEANARLQSRIWCTTPLIVPWLDLTKLVEVIDGATA